MYGENTKKNKGLVPGAHGFFPLNAQQLARFLPMNGLHYLPNALIYPALTLKSELLSKMIKSCF